MSKLTMPSNFKSLWWFLLIRPQEQHSAAACSRLHTLNVYVESAHTINSTQRVFELKKYIMRCLHDGPKNTLMDFRYKCVIPCDMLYYFTIQILFILKPLLRNQPGSFLANSVLLFRNGCVYVGKVCKRKIAEQTKPKKTELSLKDRRKQCLY